MINVVEVRNLVKVYGSIRAVDSLSFEVASGEIYGLIGPNGAGKTTTLRILATLILPTSGSVTILGHDVISEAAEVRRLISYLPGEAGAYKNLSGYEYLRFARALRCRTDTRPPLCCFPNLCDREDTDNAVQFQKKEGSNRISSLLRALRDISLQGRAALDAESSLWRIRSPTV
jgi:ABC-type branched-subunit amino acid transport system ATPase component